MKKIVGLLLLFLSVPLFALDLAITQEDFLIQIEDGKAPETDGFHLYIKKKADINSVMLVESVKDPEERIDNYSYRAEEYNAINGDELRILNGAVVTANNALISSTVVENEKLGPSFHIYVPSKIVYGYPTGRNGAVEVKDGFFLNIRTFQKKYCNYTGEYQDNPYMLKFNKKETKAPGKKIKDEDYFTSAERTFSEIADSGNGMISYSFGTNDLPDDLHNSLNYLKKAKKVEVVFAIDATGSMDDDFDALYYKWLPDLREQVKEFKDISLGLLVYKDYDDEYSFNSLPVKYYGFTKNVDEFADWVKDVNVWGGGDDPEAVYEALYASLEYFEWSPDAKRKIILIGDAEPHPYPRGSIKIDQNTVAELAAKKNITFDCIIIMSEAYRERYAEREYKYKTVDDSVEGAEAMEESLEDVK